MLKNTVKINSYEVSANGFMKLSSLMKLMQQTATDDLETYGATYENMLKDDTVFVIVKMGIEFYGEIYEGDVISITTEATGIRGVVFVREFVIEKNEKVVAKATTHWVLMSFMKRMPLRPSRLNYDREKKSMEDISESDVVFLPKSIRYDGVFEKCNTHTVRFSNLDRNRHMNNTVYADLLYDYVVDETDYPIKSCRIYYNSEAVIENELDIFSHKEQISGEISYKVSCINKKSEKNCFDAEITFRKG